MAGRDVRTTRVGGTVKVEIMDATDSRGTIANYGVVRLSAIPGRFAWHVTSGKSGIAATEALAINATAAALRYAERMRITEIVREEASMPEFMPNDLGYSVADGFTIDSEPWQQWLSAMTMN